MVVNRKERHINDKNFYRSAIFTKRWKEIGLGDDELKSLQIMLLKNPESGKVMEGTGGIESIKGRSC